PGPWRLWVGARGRGGAFGGVERSGRPPWLGDGGGGVGGRWGGGGGPGGQGPGGQPALDLVRLDRPRLDLHRVGLQVLELDELVLGDRARERGDEILLSSAVRRRRLRERERAEGFLELRADAVER